MGVHEFYLFGDVKVFGTNWTTSRGRFCVFCWENDKTEGGGWRKGTYIGDARASFKEFNVTGWIHVGVDIHYGCFGSRHALYLGFEGSRMKYER